MSIVIFMNKIISTYLESYKYLCPSLTEEELLFVSSGIKIQEYKAKQYYSKSNSIQDEIGFVYEGLIKSYYIDDYGKAITVKFTAENSYVTDYPAFVTQRPTKYNFLCIENTTVVSVSYSHIQAGYSQYPNLQRYGRIVAECYLALQQKRIESFLFQNPEQRYLDFIHEDPLLFNRVSLSDLSSYLGIERQTVTRIRKKIAKK